MTFGVQSQSLPIIFSGPANCPMKRRAETFMSGAARTLQVGGRRRDAHAKYIFFMLDIHDGMLESRLSLESGLSSGLWRLSQKLKKVWVLG